MWDPAAGKCLATLTGHTGCVKCVACFALADGTPRAISGSNDETLRVWDPTAGICLATLEGHARYVTGVACFTLADGTPRAISGSEDKTLLVWDPAAGKCLAILTGHDFYVTCVACFALADGTPRAISAGTPRAISASNDKTLLLWDPAAGTRLATLMGHTEYVTCVACFALADGTPRAISGSADTTLRVWDPAAGKCLATLTGHAGYVTGVECFTLGDGTPRAISGSDDELRVWSPVSWSEVDAQVHCELKAFRAVSDGASNHASLQDWNLAVMAAEKRLASASDAATLADAASSAAAGALSEFQRRVALLAETVARCHAADDAAATLALAEQAIAAPVAALRQAADDAAKTLASAQHLSAQVTSGRAAKEAELASHALGVSAQTLMPFLTSRLFATSDVLAPRFAARELVFGRKADAAKGLESFMCVTEEDVSRAIGEGVRGIEAEFDAMLEQVLRDPSDEDAVKRAKTAHECMRYVLHEEAGSSALVFPNSPFARDCDATGLLGSRKTAEGRGMRLADFHSADEAKMAGLSEAQVAALRI